MADITKYTAEQRRRMREQALREAEERRRAAATTQPSVRKVTPVVTKPMAASQNKYTYPRVGETAPGMPPAVRSTPDVYRREVDKKFVTDMMNNSTTRIGNFSTKPSGVSGLTSNGNVNVPFSRVVLAAEKNQLAANLNTLTRMQSQYANSDDQEMKDLLDNAYGLHMDLDGLLDSHGEYLGQFDNSQQQAAFEYDQEMQNTPDVLSFDQWRETYEGFENDKRTADPTTAWQYDQHLNTLIDYAMEQPSLRESVMAYLNTENEAYDEASRAVNAAEREIEGMWASPRESLDEAAMNIHGKMDETDYYGLADAEEQARLAANEAAPKLSRAEYQLYYNELNDQYGFKEIEAKNATLENGGVHPNEYEAFKNAAAVDFGAAEGNGQQHFMYYANPSEVATYLSLIPQDARANGEYINRGIFKDNDPAWDKANAYLTYIQDKVEQRAVNEAEEKMHQYYDFSAADSGWEKLGKGIAGTATSVAGGVLQGVHALDIYGQAFQRALTGSDEPIHFYSTAMPTKYASVPREEISGELDKLGDVNSLASKIAGKDVDIKGWGNLGVDSVYNSFVDNMTSQANVALFGRRGMGAAMGLQAAAPAMNEAHEAGASDARSILYGTGVGAAEGIGEQVGFERFLRLGQKHGLFNSKKGKLLLGMVLQPLNEGVGEAATERLDQYIDRYILDENSDYQRRIQAYISQGIAPEEAEARVTEEMGEQVVDAMLQGMLGGAMFSGGYYAADAINRAATGKGSTRKPALPTKPKATEGTSEAAKERAEARLAGMKSAEGEQSMVTDETGTEAPVTVHGITQTGKDAMVTVSDGQTDRQVKLADVAMGSDTNSEVYAYAADMATPELANVFRGRYESTQDISQVANGMQYAYDMAEQGGSIDLVRRSVLTSELTAEQLQDAYNLGVSKRTENIKSLDKAASERMQRVLGNDWHGGTVDMGDVVETSLSGKQIDDVETLRAFAGVSGYNIKLFRSTANAEGRYTQENGRYDRSTNTIWIDVNAGRNNANESMVKTAMLRTLSHETTHAIQANAPEVYARLQTAVLDVLEKQGVDIDDRIAHYMSIDSSVKTRAAALDEVVADACETMLRDSDAAQKFKEAHPEEARSLGQKILEIIKDITGAIKRAFAGKAGAKSEVSKALLKDMDAFRKVAEIWTEGAVQTGEVMGRENGRPMQQTAEASESETATETVEETVGPFDEPVRPAEAHIDRRDWDSVADDSVKAFQNEYKFARNWMGLAARALKYDVDATVPGQRFMTGEGEWSGQKRQTTDLLAYLKDEGKWTWEQIGAALDKIASFYENGDLETEMSDSRRIKRIELALDEMLSEGYTTMDGVEIAPDRGWLEYKKELPGAEAKAIPENAVYGAIEGYAGDAQFSVRKVNTEIQKSAREQTDSEEFKRWFKGSKIVNADGSPKVMYHGTPYGGFTVFKDWQYFTEDHDYADVYQTPSASSIRGRYDAATDPTTYAVYLNVKKPFDTRIPAVRRIWEREFYRQWGTGTPLMESGLPDWTDGMDIAEFIEENDYDFDGIILDEGATGGYDDEVKSRGYSVVVRNSNQIKSATDNVGSFDPDNPDIRYSLRDPYEVSDREILANALENATKNADEKAWLEAYKKDLGQLNEYQAELDKNRAVVRELLFKAGRTSDESSDLAKAQERVKYYADKLAQKDKALLKIEATAPLRAIVDREGKKVRDKMRERERAKIADIRATQENAAYRQRIVRKVKRLDELVRKPTDQKHVPDELRGSVIQLLKAFTDNTSVFQKNVLREVRDQYELLAKGESGAAGLYDEDTKERLKDLEKLMDGKRLSELSREALREVDLLIDHMSFLIDNTNSIFVNGRKETIDAIASEIVDQTLSKGAMKVNKLKNSALWKLLSTGNITPVYFFKHIGGGFQRLGDSILAGESKFGVEALKAKERIQSLMKLYNYHDWANRKNDVLKLTTEAGATLEMSREQALALYATYKRETSNKLQNASHLRTGGVILPKDPSKLDWFKGTEDVRNGAPIEAADMDKVKAWLTSEQMAYADAMVEYLSKDLSRMGNETSKTLHGYSKFGEGYYFPYKTSANFRRTNLETVEQALIKNMGFTKSVIRDASTPVELYDFTSTVAEHVNNMLMYTSFAEAQDAFIRVYDHRIDANSTVKSMLQTSFGTNTQNYMEQFLKDIYGGVTADKREDLPNKLLSAFKRNAVMGSLSVAIQQPTSVGRALALVDPKHFAIPGIKGGYTEAMQYAGTAVIKNMGRFDMTGGRSVAEWLTADAYQGIGEKTKAYFTDAEYRADVNGVLPELMDKITWGAIWRAVKHEQAQATGLDINSEELKVIAGHRFDEVIRRTQVYDSVMAKSEVMRSKSFGMKMVTAFMAEPTVTYNMGIDAVIEAKKGHKKVAARIFAAMAVASVLNNLSKALITAPRDDEEETPLTEKYLAAVFSGMLNDLNPANYVPILKDIVSVYQGYDVARTDMNIVTDIMTALQQEVKVAASGEGTFWDYAKPAAAVFSMYSGVPIKNWWRDFGAIGETVLGRRGAFAAREGGVKRAAVEGGKEFLSGMFYSFWSDSKKNNAARLLKAAVKGNEQAVSDLQTYMQTFNSMDEKQIKSSLTNALKAKFEEGDVTREDAMRVMVTYGGYTKHDAEAKIAKWMYDVDTDNEFSDMQDDFVAGNISEREAVDAMVEYGGKSEREAKAAVEKWKYKADTGDDFSDVEDMFVRGEMTRADAEEALIEYGGYRKSEAADKVQQWQYEIDTGRKYSEMKDDYLDGTIKTNKEAEEYRVKYGGQDPDAAKASVMQWQYDKDTGRVYSEMRYDYADGIITRAETEGYLVKYGLKEPDEAYWTAEGWKYESDGESEWSGKFTHLSDAMDKNSASDIDKAISQVYANSSYKDDDAAASAVVSAITSKYKPMYIAASEAEREELETLLLYAYRRAYELADKPWYGDSRRLKTIRKWLETDD